MASRFRFFFYVQSPSGRRRVNSAAKQNKTTLLRCFIHAGYEVLLFL
jgi:hypothetical protein